MSESRPACWLCLHDVEHQTDCRANGDCRCDCHRVRGALAEIYHPEGIDIWMRARNRMLGDERPVDLIRDGQAERVLALIEALATGAVL